MPILAALLVTFILEQWHMQMMLRFLLLRRMPSISCLKSVISMQKNFVFHLMLIRANVLSLDKSGSKLMRFSLKFLLAANLRVC
jgi:hypothetical protein